MAEQTVGPDGATVEGDGFWLVVPTGAFATEATIEVGSRPADEHPLLDSRLTSAETVYRFTGIEEFSVPLSIELTFDPAKRAEGDTILVYFEEEVRSAGGAGYVRTGWPLEHSVIDWEAGVIMALIPPHVSAGREKSGAIEFIVSVAWNGGIDWVTTDEDFRICWNTGDVDQVWIDGLMADLIEAKAELDSKGFEFCGSTYDYINVHVRTVSGADGNFFQSGWGVSSSFIEIDPAKDGTERKAAAGHELFHFYQMCYGICGHAYGYNHEWLSEACSVWFEPVLLADATYIPTVLSGNRDFINKGLETNTAAIGYGASTFMIWLTDKYDENLILDIHREAALNPNTDCASAKAVDAALVDRASNLTAEFRAFSREFMLGTTGHDWTFADPEFLYLTPADPSESYTYSMPDLSARSVVAGLNAGGGDLPAGSLTVELTGTTSAAVEAFVYHGEANNGPWHLAGTATDGAPVVVPDFGTGEARKVKTVLVNSRTPVTAADASAATISFDFEELQDAYPADLFKFELQTELTMASGPGSTGNRLWELRFPIAVSGNTFTASWDTTYDNGNVVVGEFSCTVNAAQDALIGWTFTQDTYSPLSDVNFHKSATGTGPIPLVLLNETNMKFDTGEGTGTCDIITNMEYWYSDATSGEVLDEMTSYQCLHNSYLTLWLWNTD